MWNDSFMKQVAYMKLVYNRFKQPSGLLSRWGVVYALIVHILTDFETRHPAYFVFT